MGDGSIRRWRLALFWLLLCPGGHVALAGADVSRLPGPPPGYRWESVPALTDEFGGKHLDTEKWMPLHPYWSGREPSHFDPGNVSVQDGKLLLRSTTRVNDMARVADPLHDVWVQSACVSSKLPIAGFGYYEARVKASRLPMTSSFWFQGKYSEIDVVEEIGQSLKNPSSDTKMLMNTHYFANGWEHDAATPRQWTMPTGSADTYHVYGVWWKDQDTLIFYHDGRQVAEAKPAGAFAEPMYLFFDTEVFTWEGLPSLDALNDPKRDTMSVDWVRSWKLMPVRH